MKKRKRQQKRHERLIVIAFSFAFGVVMVLGSTYAWITLADTRINRMNSGHLDIVLEGRSEADVLTPVYHAKKNIAARNDSNTNALIRVSLSEVMLQFKLDTTESQGTGHLKEVSPSSTVVNLSDSTTWQIGNTYKTPTSKIVEGLIRTENPSVIWPTVSGSRPQEFEESTKLNFTERLTDTHPAPVSFVRNYWIYYEGYYYYSEILRPAKETPVLLETIKVPPKAPNHVKGSLYEMQGVVESYPASKKALTDSTFGWGLPESSPVYQALKDKVK